MENLDQRAFQTWDREPVLDASDEADWVNLCTDILQQPTNERYAMR